MAMNDLKVKTFFINSEKDQEIINRWLKENKITRHRVDHITQSTNSETSETTICIWYAVDYPFS